MSSPATGKNIPEMPPSVNVTRKPSDQRVWVFMTKEPPHSVASQLKIFAPVGMATSMVVIMNAARQKGSIPEVSMWCPQTMKPTMPMPAMANTIDL